MGDVLPFDPGLEGKKLQKTFNGLPVERQLEVVLSARGKERLRYLFLSEHPERLVERLPELEIFLTVKEVGRSDAIDLVSITTPEQFLYLLDLDLWKRDEVDLDRVVRWMEILLECGEKKVTQFIQASDPELLSLILIKFLHVIKLEGELTESADRKLPFNLDREYFILFKDPETQVVFQNFLQILYHFDSNLYRLLMESLIHELESSLEETAYRFRNARLADYGFPDLPHAAGIYQPLPPALLRMEKETLQDAHREPSEKARAPFYLTPRNEGPFFSSILSKVSEPTVQDRLQAELAHLCNKAMVAELIDFFSTGEMERTVIKVFHYLNLGLEYLSAGEEEKALDILQTWPLQKVFQSGVGATVWLRRKAEGILKGPWFAADRERLSFLEPGERERFEGLLRKRPGVYRNGTIEDFKNIQDFGEMVHFLDRIETVVSLLIETYKISPEAVKKLDLTGCIPRESGAVTFSTLVLTALAHRVLKGTFRVETLTKEAVKEFMAQVLQRDETGQGRIKTEIRNEVREQAASSRQGDQRRHVLEFWDFCLDLLENEFGRLTPTDEIDPRFVRGLIIKE